MAIRTTIELNYKNTERLATKTLDYWKTLDRTNEEQLVLFAETSTILIAAREQPLIVYADEPFQKTKLNWLSYWLLFIVKCRGTSISSLQGCLTDRRLTWFSWWRNTSYDLKIIIAWDFHLINISIYNRTLASFSFAPRIYFKHMAKARKNKSLEAAGKLWYGKSFESKAFFFLLLYPTWLLDKTISK